MFKFKKRYKKNNINAKRKSYTCFSVVYEIGKKNTSNLQLRGPYLQILIIPDNHKI